MLLSGTQWLWVLRVTGSPAQALLRAPALRRKGRASTFKIFAEDFIGDDDSRFLFAKQMTTMASISGTDK